MTVELADRRVADSAATARAFRDGVRAIAPVLAALVPLSLVVGQHIAAGQHPFAGWAGSWVVYSIGAQLAALDVLAHGSSWVSATAVGLLVNLRLAAYATSMQPDWATAPLSRRVLAGLVLSDPPWALSRARDVRDRRAFYLGAALVMFVVYPILTGIGVLVGARLTDVALLALLPALGFSAMIAPQLKQRVNAIAAGAASLCGIATLGLAAGPSLALTGVVGGAAAWLTWESR
jgi:predicted branched-subunit amino acid permease